MKFYASLRMDVRKIETMKKDGEVVGSRVRIKVVKNKVAPPFKEAEFTINSKGIDRLDAIVDMAINSGLFTKSGAFIRYGEKMMGQGKEQAKETLLADEKLMNEITKAVMEKVKIVKA